LTRGDYIEEFPGDDSTVAALLRARFLGSDALALNIVGSPGSGKTTLLERTLPRLPVDVRAAVLTGDIATETDAARLATLGFPVAQIATGGICHLTAAMVRRGLERLGPNDFDILFIENIGSLLCPARIDLGESSKVVVLSVTEGDDKPLKYPEVFARVDLLVLNKIDLLSHVNFDIDHACNLARSVHPALEIIEVSCETGEGIEDWVQWVVKRLLSVRSPTAFLHGIR